MQKKERENKKLRLTFTKFMRRNRTTNKCINVKRDEKDVRVSELQGVARMYCLVVCLRPFRLL